MNNKTLLFCLPAILGAPLFGAQPVMTVRLAQTAASSTGWTKLGIVASRQMQARLAPDVEIQDADYRLSNALYLLN